MSRPFPIMGYREDQGPQSVPFEFAEQYPHITLNHGQTLEQLAARGGITAGELLAAMEGRRWRERDKVGSGRRLIEAVADWASKNAGYADAQGYARCTADVVAMLKNHGSDAVVARAVVRALEEGKHIGAADRAKGGRP